MPTGHWTRLLVLQVFLKVQAYEENPNFSFYLLVIVICSPDYRDSSQILSDFLLFQTIKLITIR
jgi:hypothetical protein